jgi:Ca2+-transporting ATPase
LAVDPAHGLDNDAVRARLATHGPNELIERGAKSPWRILWEQFSATMVLILIGAGLLSIFLGKANESISIFAIVILFGLLGFVQEYRAERAMAALKQMSVPQVRVRRNGVTQMISARDLTVGDIVLLEAGSVVPADLRLIEAVNLRIQEAALTGEAEAVEKTISTFSAENMPLGDRRNMAYMGTTVTYGRGAGVVTGVGMQAELGKIAAMLQAVKSEETPLQQRLDHLGKRLALAGLLVALIILGIGLLHGGELEEMFLTAVSVAVAIIPEGLPAVVTFTLALGAHRMLQRNALIRKLPAVETLGSVTTICSDKTGTLTENRMTVVVLDVAGHRVLLEQSVRHSAPVLDQSDRSLLTTAGQLTAEAQPLGLLLLGGALCNDALIEVEPNSKRLQTIGDPTEGALLVAGGKAGIERRAMERVLPRVGELPFDSERKRMTTVHAVQGDLPAQIAGAQALTSPFVAFTKGAVDGLLDISTRLWIDGQIQPLTEAFRHQIEKANADLAENGMRVLGVAFQPLEHFVDEPSHRDGLERDLIFVGFFGIIDPPRAEVRDAVRTCKSAGIRPVMITGDHPLTARYIASDLGILEEETTLYTNGAPLSPVMTGAQLEQMSDKRLGEIVEFISVYARVSPEHKLRIVRSLQEKGHIVAMTGDGVNDAPALKQADIGVAMGITGTDVSKEAADMVLRDDNFTTIVAAVEEGRTIYDNVRRFVKFSVAGNIGKVLVMLLAPFLGMPIALLPLQLLWLNLLTDGLLGLGMGFEPAERGAMRRPPVSPRSGIFSRGLSRHVSWVGALIGLLALGTGFAYWQQGDPSWQMMIFNTLAFAQIGQALASRSNRESLFHIGLFSNKPLLGMVILVTAAQVAVMLLPFLGTFFNTEAMGSIEWFISIGLGVLVFAAIEVEKWLIRRQDGASVGRVEHVLTNTSF